MSEFTTKVVEGTKLAIKKLVEETAAKGGELVIRGEDGQIKTVPAKELLPLVQNQEAYL